MTSLNLRPYQEEAIKSVKDNFKKGIDKQVIVMATGLGKTIVFSKLISDLIAETGKKALVIAHREELLEQAKDKLFRTDGGLKIEIEKAEQHAGTNANVIVASVPTLGRSNSNRILKFDPKDFCTIIVDEAHHASADTYRNVFEKFGVLKDKEDANWNKELLLLGVTATPSRTDNKGIDKIFDKVTYEYGIIKAIEDGWLVRIKAFRVDTSTDLRNVHRTAGDFNVGELAEAVNTEDRNGTVVSAYKRMVPDKKALCFAVDVQHTIDLCARFNEEGVPAGYIIGSTPKEERHATLKKFTSGEIKVLVNCAVLTEGFDEPSIDVILMARPTQSGILFQQMIGRGTRLFEGKEYLTIIDFHDNTYRQKLQTTASLLGVQGAVDFKGQDILEVGQKINNLLELAPNADLEKLDIEKIDYAIEEVDLLSGLQVPTEIDNFTKYDWHRYDENSYHIGLGNDITLSIKKTLTGQFEISKLTYDRTTKRVSEYRFPSGTRNTLEDAVRVSDAYIDKSFPDSIGLVATTARWRNLPPSDAQLDLLRKMRVNDSVINELDKGKASRLITKLINRNDRERIRRFNSRW